MPRPLRHHQVRERQGHWRRGVGHAAQGRGDAVGRHRRRHLRQLPGREGLPLRHHRVPAAELAAVRRVVLGRNTATHVSNASQKGALRALLLHDEGVGVAAELLSRLLATPQETGLAAEAGTVSPEIASPNVSPSPTRAPQMSIAQALAALQQQQAAAAAADSAGAQGPAAPSTHGPAAPSSQPELI